MKEIREDLNVQISVVSTTENQEVDLATFLLTVGRDAVTVEDLDFPDLGE